ncbi:O-methyltransferase family 2 [Botryosphaeria dothidea]|uniref:O-methyltransferase family 2 n=1 Tax=Botryosphaeria dothidea TaxID=55169 RepID=A0A8H4IZR6_9PEZI|nr:O-methyltransferase family 2 [Botryosphaeria dothidea]
MQTSEANHSEIDQALRLISSSGQQYLDLIKSNAGRQSRGASEEIAEAKELLLAQAMQIIQTVSGPHRMVFKHGETAAHTGAVRALLEMGVFNMLPENGSMTATKLSKELVVDKELLVRLMRIATTLGPFKEVGTEEYSHTEYSKVYLQPQMRGMLKILNDEHGPAYVKLWEFFKSNGWQNPTSATNNPYTHAHQTGGKNVFEYMTHYPERVQAFNDAMGAHTQSSSAWTVETYPFAAELSQMNTDDNTILFVDIGGGKGHVTRHVRSLCPDIKGKMVFTDREPVIADVVETMPGVEKMAYDFFTEQPIKGALVYYLRRVLHDWPDEDCVNILKNVAAGMDPGKSRLVICELVVPPVGASAEACWTDITMMTFSGTERTASQYDKLLAAAGLKPVKVHTAHGTNYGAIEARLQ